MITGKTKVSEAVALVQSTAKANGLSVGKSGRIDHLYKAIEIFNQTK